MSSTALAAVPLKPATQCAAGCDRWSLQKEFGRGLCFGWPVGAVAPSGARIKGPGCVEVVEPLVCSASLFGELDGPLRRDAEDALAAAKTLTQKCRTTLAEVQARMLAWTRNWWPYRPSFGLTWKRGSTEREREVRLAAHRLWLGRRPTAVVEAARIAAVLLPHLTLRQAASFPEEVQAVYGGRNVRSDVDFVLKAAERDGDALRYASDVRATPAVALAAIASRADAFQHAAAELRTGRDFVLAAVERNGYALEHVGTLRADRDVVLVAVRNVGDALRHASSALRADRDVVLAAVRNDGAALQHASSARRADRDVVLAAVRNDGAVLQHASAGLRADRDVVLAAVKNHGAALCSASEELRDDFDVVLAAVRQHGLAVQCSGATTSSDRRIALAAVTQDGEALRHVGAAFGGDEEIVRAAVRTWGAALQHASAKLRDNLDVVMAAVAQQGEALQYASRALRDRADVVLAAVARDGRALLYASRALKANAEIVAAAIERNGDALIYASETLKANKTLALAAVRTSEGSNAFGHLPTTLRGDRDVALAAAEHTADALRWTSAQLRNDPTFGRAVYTSWGESLARVEAMVAQSVFKIIGAR